MLDEQYLQVEGAVHTIQGNAMKVMCNTGGFVKANHHFHSTDPDPCGRQFPTTWSLKNIKYEGVQIKTTQGSSTARLLGIYDDDDVKDVYK